MTTTNSSLIERIRAELVDYGDGATTLASAVSSTSATSVTLTSSLSVSEGGFLHIDSESMLVLEVNRTTNVCTVQRGSKGSTAATHTSGTLVYINLDYSNLQILQAINGALSYAYPRLYALTINEDLDTIDDTSEYDFPDGFTADKIVRVEMETYDGSGLYQIDRFWDMLDSDTVRIYGTRSEGLNIRLVGMSKFTAGVLSDNLDSDFPDDDSVAIDYLVARSCSSLLRSTQGRVAQLDTFQGITDRFTAGQPYVPINTSNQYRIEAEALLRRCAMEPPDMYLPHPNRRMYGVG